MVVARSAAELPVVAPLAASTNGYVTFGGLNRVAKINDSDLALWSRVLARVPQQEASGPVQTQSGQEAPRVRVLARVPQQGASGPEVQTQGTD